MFTSDFVTFQNMICLLLTASNFVILLVHCVFVEIINYTKRPIVYRNTPTRKIYLKVLTLCLYVVHTEILTIKCNMCL